MNPVITPNPVAAPPRTLERLLRPRSVAIIGASTKPGALGTSVLSNLERGGYAGKIHLVNPKRPVIGGRTAYASVDEIPGDIDCAILAVPGPAVLDSVRALAARGAGAAVIFSAGFAENGESGRAQQEELVRIADAAQMVLLGPNCLGLVNHDARAALTFVETSLAGPAPGRTLGIVSQSGAMAAVLSVVVASRDIPVSLSVSTGNEANTGVEDFVEHLVADEHTGVILMLVEQFRAPQRFLAAARAARRAGKLIVLLHPGTSSAARESAATHTGAMAGDHAVMSVLVERAGVLRVDTLEELADVGEIAVRCAPARPQGPAVIGESGAFKALTLDFAERLGLPIPAVTDEQYPQMRAALPAFVALSNPLDITAQGLVDPDIYGRLLTAGLTDDRFGSVVLNIIQTDAITTGIKMPPVLAALQRGEPTKPLIFAGMDEGAPVKPELIAELRDHGVPYFPSPERALRAIARLTAAAASTADESTRPEVTLGDPGTVDADVPEYLAKAFLAPAGIPFPQGGFATTADEAVGVAQKVGFPVVLKAQSARLPHKSDAGGVILRLADAAAVREGWDRLYANVAAHDPDLTLDGVLVEAMGAPGTELIIGARRDPEWGPVVLIGFGGVTAELHRDVRLIAADLSPAEVRAELGKLRAAALFDGFRGSPALDITAVADLVTTIGAVMIGNPTIAEIDLNPVVVRPDGQGVLVLDALALLTTDAVTAP